MYSGKVSSQWEHGLRISALQLRWPSSSHRGVSADLELAVGSVCGLMGASGSGKSTLLKACSGWSSRLAGSIQIHSPSPQLLASDIAILPQDSMDIILPWYRVGRNLEVAASLLKSTVTATDIKDFASLLGLNSDHLRRHPRQMSGGERRRLALGMTIIRGGRLLLLDEPFTGLDFDLRMRLWDVVHKAVKLPQQLPFPVAIGAVLLTSHGLDDASCLCDRTYVLKQDGRALCVDRGASAEVHMPSSLFASERDPKIVDYESRLREAMLSS